MATAATATTDVVARHNKPLSANVDLNEDLSGTTLVAGVLADVSVGKLASAKAGAHVKVVCEHCLVKGDVKATVDLEHLSVGLDLKDIEAALDLDIEIGAAATIAVGLIEPAKVTLPFAGLNVEALVALDLVLGVHTELDVSAGIYVKLPEATLTTDILSGDLLDSNIAGNVVVKVLPIEIRIGCTEILADLRLRVDLGVAAEVDVDDLLPLDKLLGLDIPEIGAGLDVSVFANLLEYVGFFCASPSCPVSYDSYGLNAGAAVELDVAVEDLLSLNLAPSVALGLFTIPRQTYCVPPVVPTGSASIDPSVTASVTASITAVPATTGSISSGLVPTQVTSTHTYTVTQCACKLANCPSQSATTHTLTETTSYVTYAPSTSSATFDYSTVTGHPSTMTPCSTKTTFTPSSYTPAPTSVATSSAPASSSYSAVSSVQYSASSASSSSPAGTSSYGVSSSTQVTSVAYSTALASSSTAAQTSSYPAASSSSYVAVSSSYPAGGESSSYAGSSSTLIASSSTAAVSTPGSSSYVATSSGYSAAQSSSYPAGGQSSSYGAGSSSSSVPVSSSYSAIPTVSYPAGGASSSYGAGSSSYVVSSSYSAVPSSSMPAGGSSQSYSGAPGASSSSYPSYPTGVATYPAGGQMSYSVSPATSTYPVGGAGYPTPSSYPTGASNGTVPTYGSGYPTAVPTAGVAKIGSSIALLFAAVVAVL
ncbi:hypothetical protein GGR57DRAFT_501699 [Xylariaceae sp. FL1272]|nr:hypothetical protein GGR57DRAFT_501699 [Xylariaceae sp. FL1272]